VIRFRRNPDLLICWKAGQLLVEDLTRKRNILATAELVTVLSAFEQPLSVEESTRVLSGFTPKSVAATVRRLVKEKLLLPEEEANRRRSRIEAWTSNLASAFYHVASRDLRYIQGDQWIDHYLRVQVAPKPRPPTFRTYPGLPAVPLRVPERSSDSPGELERVLAARRTVREFSRKSVSYDDLSIVVRGTWGQTGWLDGGPLGRLAVKTSPSAGALHPIECYVVAWRVEGLEPGLYHYDVGENALRQLRRGDLRKEAVRAASGQQWVGRAAFCCILTAVFTRTLWKYEDETAFKVLWLDAGHLTQTFCLLATSRGLGPFQTAALQDSYIDNLIGLDGVTEFPVYLCGAGVPARTATPTASPRRCREPRPRRR